MRLKYRVHHARGTLFARQQAASAAGCQCYAEQHLNSVGPDKAHVNYVMAIVAANASEASKDWARTYTRLTSELLGSPDHGVVIGPCRGSYNVQVARCPSVLLEPGFISNPDFSNRIQLGGGALDDLALCLARSIRLCFLDPTRGPVGLSAGHAFRGKRDPGAPVHNKSEELVDKAFDDEDELNIEIINVAAAILQSGFDGETDHDGTGRDNPEPPVHA
jgi:hypothetical protein